jgi:hypothetical protein
MENNLYILNPSLRYIPDSMNEKDTSRRFFSLKMLNKLKFIHNLQWRMRNVDRSESTELILSKKDKQQGVYLRVTSHSALQPGFRGT